LLLCSYVAPENVLGRGYNNSVDWWTLGVLMYVLLTARQPFSSPKTGDPMEVGCGGLLPHSVPGLARVCKVTAEYSDGQRVST
jgi:serine/threonine protein kinase